MATEKRKRKTKRKKKRKRKREGANAPIHLTVIATIVTNVVTEKGRHVKPSDMIEEITTESMTVGVQEMTGETITEMITDVKRGAIIEIVARDHALKSDMNVAVTAAHLPRVVIAQKTKNWVPINLCTNNDMPTSKRRKTCEGSRNLRALKS